MKKILIIGAGTAGKDVVREINKTSGLGLVPVGFIDDDPEKFGKAISGLKVLGTKKDLKGLIKRRGIKEVIVAIPSAQGEQISEYVKICSDVKVAFRIVPRVKEIIEGKAHIKSLRKVQVEDLLGRPVVKADIVGLKAFFKGKKVLVTGAAGSIGSELSRQIVAYKPKKIILLDWWENGMFDLQIELEKYSSRVEKLFIIGNIQEKEKVRRVFEHYKPNCVFHAAAYKHVPMMENNPVEAVKNNVFGTLNVAREAKKLGAEKFVLVSTDKAANPVNVMGATKLIAEGIVKKLNGKTKFIVVRFGNVLDSFGSVIPVFRRQIEEGGPVTITDKRMTRFFMTIPEAAQLILKTALIGKGEELFVLDMGKPIKIFDLAENFIRLSGYIPHKDIKIAITGPRKGEKITEELFTAKEKLVTTKEKKIFVTQSMGFDIAKLPQTLKRLGRAVKSGSKKLVRKELSKVLGSFPK